MRLHVAYESGEKIRCSFFTVVVRNKALAKLYKGGLTGFLDKYGARCNQDITVDCYMGGDIDDTVKDLLGNGLTMHEDFTVFDAEGYTMDLNMIPDDTDVAFSIDFEANWLKAMCTRDGFYVWYAAGGLI
jgi:hypothetical protein